MTRKKPTILGKFELEIMHIIWDKGKATVQEVRDALSEEHPAAYTTFLTMMQRMEGKGILKHEIHKDGKTYVYNPLITREEVSTNMFRDVYQRLFRGSSRQLLDVLNPLFRSENMTSEDIERLKELIDEKESKNE